MSEMENFVAYWRVVPPDALIAKGDFEQPGSSTDITKDPWYIGAAFSFDMEEEMDARRELRRLKFGFVQESAKRESRNVEIFANNDVFTIRKRITVEGRIRRRPHSHDRSWSGYSWSRRISGANSFNLDAEGFEPDYGLEAEDQKVIGAEEAELSWREVYGAMYTDWQESTIETTGQLLRPQS